MNLVSLQAKGVKPRASVKATLRGWELTFNVRHWFRHEGGMGNIKPAGPERQVLGVLHLCEDRHLALLDAVEAYGVGYDRIEVDVETADGSVRALTYIGLPGYLDDSCLPTRRYMNILLQGAVSARLDLEYIDSLRQQRLQPEWDYPPFRTPEGSYPVFNAQSLEQQPLYTALAGAVFDMQGARPELNCLHALFGGRDMTLFHLGRLDTSDGRETLEDLRAGRISEMGRRYLNAYLHEYSTEYRYVGRYLYD